jgi:hypothetical protein
MNTTPTDYKTDQQSLANFMPTLHKIHIDRRSTITRAILAGCEQAYPSGALGEGGAAGPGANAG